MGLIANPNRRPCGQYAWCSALTFARPPVTGRRPRALSWAQKAIPELTLSMELDGIDDSHARDSSLVLAATARAIRRAVGMLLAEIDRKMKPQFRAEVAARSDGCRQLI